ncbi:hypothetical protein J2X12_004242 [Pseudarthrobacter oxydans]|uniref:Uncharacterized protein n=1 Tax=Pseudarthrobacter oxydans TaxID=1671 RepID=A0AAW8NJT5_PSEOX|nr:hypothetical protein [Pseudarthrobacter oxydans]MDR6794751.1 hypothetical protein [Pseudarthrobacter oxydans]MDR7166188.1 hypothetical protein [Pseudarthrobacter oxydans]
MKTSNDLYAGWTESEAAVLAVGSVVLVVFILSLALLLWIVRTARKNPRAGELAGRMMMSQFRFYGKQFKSGYDKEMRKNWGIGLLALSVPAVTAEEVNQSFSNGLFTIFKGAWDILAPYVGAVLVFWLILLVIRRVSGGGKRS